MQSYARASFDGYNNMNSFSDISQLPQKISAVRQLASNVGIAGGLVGFSFENFGTGVPQEVTDL